MAEVEKNGHQVPWQRAADFTRKPRPDEENISIDGSSIDSLAAGKTQERWAGKTRGKKRFAKVNEGYVNPAFVGSTDRLDLDRATADKHGK